MHFKYKKQSAVQFFHIETKKKEFYQEYLLYCSYMVSIGLVDILARRCMKVRETVENHKCVVLSLLGTLGLLTKIAELCPKGKLTQCIVCYRTRGLFQRCPHYFQPISQRGSIRSVRQDF